jgi:hypothetical protein
MAEPQKYHISPEGVAYVTVTPETARSRGRTRRWRRFTKVPGTWEEVLGKDGASGCAYAVAIVLLHEAWRLVSRGHKPVVKLTNGKLKRVGVGERGKRSALLRREVGTSWCGTAR